MQTKDEVYRTAKVDISLDMFMGITGMKDFCGVCVRAETKLDSLGKTITLYLAGNDDRIPEGSDFPECSIVCQTVQSKLEKR